MSDASKTFSGRTSVHGPGMSGRVGLSAASLQEGGNREWFVQEPGAFLFLKWPFLHIKKSISNYEPLDTFQQQFLL